MPSTLSLGTSLEVAKSRGFDKLCHFATARGLADSWSVGPGPALGGWIDVSGAESRGARRYREGSWSFGWV